MPSIREQDSPLLETASMQDGRSAPAQPTTSAQRSDPPKASVTDLWNLALKLEKLTRIAQQSLLLVALFGLTVSCMWYGDIEHMYVLGLFTVCSYVLLRWGVR